MKYTVEGFNQATLIELGLDHIDALILRWFIDFQGTGKMTQYIVKNAVYSWVFYQTVMDDIPCAGIHNRRSCSRRFEKLCNSGVLASRIVKNATGTKVFYKTGQYYSRLIEPTVLLSTPPTVLLSTPIDSSIKEDIKSACAKQEYEEPLTEDELIQFESNRAKLIKLFRDKE